MKKLLAVLLLAAVGAAAGVAYLLRTPHATFEGEKFVLIPRGTGTSAMAALLEENGVLKNRLLFSLLRALRPKAKLQAGEYRFSRPASAWEVFDRIARGDIYYFDWTVPEGSNLFEIAALFAGAGLGDAQTFLQFARDGALVRDLAPGAPSLEGFLFPATYKLTRQSTAAGVCRMMTQRFRVAWKQALKVLANGTGAVRVSTEPASVTEPRALASGQGAGTSAEPGGTPRNILETVTLASLVEKETSVASERPVVAGVYRNRLDRKIKLECDPTTIYAALLEGRWRGTIYKSDLEREHPYNTYRVAGLPPGPIANPGQPALEAALKPAATRNLFFVAKPDRSGGHIFSENLAGHNKAVGEYRRGQQKDAVQGHPSGATPRAGRH